MPSRRYRFGPGIGVEIAGESRILEFFEAEYGPAADTQERGLPEVRVSLATAALAPGEAPRVSGRHKTVGWEVDLPDPAAHPLRASIRVMGRPRPFVLSLVQGFFIEPLISIAMARSQCVLLPAAGIVGGAGVTVLIGPSRSGKSSVSALALARGRQVLGDDQVIVSSGGCQVFWRRLRLYHDLPEVVPAAYGALAAPARRSIAILRLLASASRGYIRPPLRLAPTALSGSPVPPGALPIARAILLGRSPSPDLAASEADLEALVGQCLGLLGEQRAHLAAHPRWGEALGGGIESEGAYIRAAFARACIERLTVPQSWPPDRAVAAIAAHLGLV